jgi:hypothetical protein
MSHTSKTRMIVRESEPKLYIPQNQHIRIHLITTDGSSHTKQYKRL